MNDQLFAQRLQVIPRVVVRVSMISKAVALMQMIPKMQMKPKEIVRIPKTGAVVDTTAIVSEIACSEAAIPLSLGH
jgi:hypothetical protein